MPWEPSDSPAPDLDLQQLEKFVRRWPEMFKPHPTIPPPVPAKDYDLARGLLNGKIVPLREKRK